MIIIKYMKFYYIFFFYFNIFVLKIKLKEIKITGSKLSTIKADLELLHFTIPELKMVLLLEKK